MPANRAHLWRLLALWAAWAFAIAIVTSRASADDARASAGGAVLPSISDEAILGKPAPVSLESIMMRYTVFSQDGHGYQSRSSTPGNPGSEWMRVYEPVLEVVFRQGENWKHRFFVPADFVTSASPVVPGPDAVTAASKVNQGGSLDWTGSYRIDPRTTYTFRAVVHIERMYRSWVAGLGWSRSFAGDDATLAATINQVTDWFDKYDVTGTRYGHANRSSTNGNLAFTRVLTPTTIAEANYGYTLQTGELGNTWGSVLFSNGRRGTESYPNVRQRHALVGRIAQWLPWSGAVRLFARLYADDWSIMAGTFEAELLQRISPALYVRASYRIHRQSGASFFNTFAEPGTTPVTSDSDLQSLTAQSIGLKVSADIPVSPSLLGARTTHVDVGLSRYFRDNDLDVWVFSCGFGLRF